jgi:hypothetical protein
VRVREGKRGERERGEGGEKGEKEAMFSPVTPERLLISQT